MVLIVTIAHRMAGKSTSRQQLLQQRHGRGRYEDELQRLLQETERRFQQEERERRRLWQESENERRRLWQERERQLQQEERERQQQEEQYIQQINQRIKQINQRRLQNQRAHEGGGWRSTAMQWFQEYKDMY